MKVRLKNSLFILPNAFTLSSVFCGFYAVVLLSQPEGTDRFYRAAMLVVLAMFLDTIDGRVARLTRTQSAIGVQLDSLADVISFGVAPSLLVYRWSLDELGLPGLVGAFSFTAAGVVRLARFNVISTGTGGVPKKPSKYIQGLPIPGAAGVLVSLAVAQHLASFEVDHLRVWVLLLVLGLAFLMVSTIRFRSFKEVRLSPLTVSSIVVVLAATLYIALRFHLSLALAWLLLGYVLLGIVESLIRITRRTAKKPQV